MEKSVDKFDCGEKDEDEKRVDEPSVPLKCCEILKDSKKDKIFKIVIDSYQMK